jgi:hypothetical protein
VLQNQIEGEGWDVEVRILGVNGMGLESGNAAACVGKDLPWLQETMDHPVWVPWAVTYRDVVILDRANKRVASYNLTDHDLSDPGNYLELKTLLQSATGAR